MGAHPPTAQLGQGRARAPVLEPLTGSPPEPVELQEGPSLQSSDNS